MDALRFVVYSANGHAPWTRAVISILLLVSGASPGSAQSILGGDWFVRSGATSGYILPANPFMADADHPGGPIRWGRNLTVEVGRQTDGNQEWHQLYGVPSYGFGFSIASFRNDVEHARPMEAYTFFSWPFARLSDRFDLTTDFGMGMSWHWKEMTDQAESYETSLGSDLNARINWGFYLRYVSTPRVTLFTGVDYTHRSNGGMVQPDRGINVIGPKVALQYSLAPAATRRRTLRPPPFHPTWEFVAGGTGGVKNVIERADPLTRDNYWSLNATSALQRQFYRYGKIAFGTDLAYDGATGARIDGADTHWRADGGQRWVIGVYGGYEHIVGRFGALVQVGENVMRRFDDPDTPRLYQRFGWRYHVSDRLWSTIVIRAVEGRRADALQFGIGYRTRLFDK